MPKPPNISDSSLNTFSEFIIKNLIDEILQINKRDINNNESDNGMRDANKNENKIENKIENNIENNIENKIENKIEEPSKNKKIIIALDSHKENQDKNTQPVYLITNNKRAEMNNIVKNLNLEFDKGNYDNIFFSGISEKSIIKPSKSNSNLLENESYSLKEKINIEMEINSITDLLSLIEKYPIISNVDYNINLQAIHNIKEPLEDLNSMIGMNHLKNNIMDQILYFVQDLHIIKTKKKNIEGDFMHTVIYGPPGTGKTEIARIMGKIFSKLGILKKGTFRKATRSDLIAGYLGQTALKTRDLIRDSLDGVLFIDEAYALGNSEKRDSFAKECIDTLCEALSDNKDRLMVIIAGYENELNECFFKYNQGLESRFTWRFKTDDYNAKELMNIFIKKVDDSGWSFKDINEIKVSWFQNNMDYFKYYGRDMETLFAKTKISHGRRVFCKEPEEKTKISLSDLEQGFNIYISNEEVKLRKENMSFNFKNSMYM